MALMLVCSVYLNAVFPVHTSYEWQIASSAIPESQPPPPALL